MMVGHISNGSEPYVRPLTEEEKQLFAELVAKSGRRFLAAMADQAINSIEESEEFAESKVQAVSPNEHPPVPELESSRSLMPVRNLEFRSPQVAMSLHRRARRLLVQFVLPALVCAIVFLLVLNFYPLVGSSLPGSARQTETLIFLASNPPQIAIPTPAAENTGSAAHDSPVRSEVEALPATQVLAEPDPAIPEPPQISENVQPTVRKRTTQASPIKKQSHQHRSTQLTEPAWSTGPAWSRNADTFVTFLFFGRVN
jgi:hypothetical protein